MEISLGTADGVALAPTGLLAWPHVFGARGDGFTAHTAAGWVAVPLLEVVSTLLALAAALALAGLSVVEGETFAITIIAASGVLLDVHADAHGAAAGHPHVDY